MKCPVCSRPLLEVSSDDLKLDICRQGCGGVWFDAHELDSVDEMHEQVSWEVLRPVSNQEVVVDRNATRVCPRCESVPLEKELYEQQFEIEVDSCPSCNGVWLDLGELQALRTHNSKQQERRAVISSYEELSKSGSSSIRKRLAAVYRLMF